MEKIKLISWNVNGIRAIEKKSALKWIDKEDIHFLGIQEIKSQISQIPSTIFNKKYKHLIASESEIKGRSGTALFTDFDLSYSDICNRVDILNEGRINEVHFTFSNKDIVLFNVYFPNGQSKEERLTYKMGFYDRFLDYCEELRTKGKSIIICGDVNTAHKPIDLARPKQNEKVSGFLPMEREWIDKLLDKGYIDTFREINGDLEDKYSWWGYRGFNKKIKNPDTGEITKVYVTPREENIGWRIDYFFISEDLKQNLEEAFILDNVMGSDHCPIGITLKKI